MNNLNNITSVLPINFHETFVITREYLKRILQFAKDHGRGRYQDIQQITQIPMGKHSGKVSSTISYAKGMDLIQVYNDSENTKSLLLTPLGEKVLEEDQYLNEELTQWIVHFNLCRKNGGSVVWNAVFSESQNVIGYEFNEEELKDYLSTKFVSKSRSIIGPIIGVYNGNSSLGSANCIKKKDDTLVRQKAPIKASYSYGYGYLFLKYWEEYFTNRDQISVAEYEKETAFFSTLGWTQNEINTILDLWDIKHLILLDRHFGDPIISKTTCSEIILGKIFSELI